MTQTEFAIMVIVLLVFDILINSLIFLDNKKERKNQLQEIPTLIKQPKDIESMRLILQEDYFKKVVEMFDSFISLAGENYLVFVLSSNSNHYLTEKETEQMMSYIFGMVKKNITDEVKDVLSTIYNINSDEDIDEFLNIRIKLYIIGFIKQYNAMPTEDIPNIPASK